MRVLVVDDDYAVLDAIKDVLGNYLRSTAQVDH